MKIPLVTSQTLQQPVMKSMQTSLEAKIDKEVKDSGAFLVITLISILVNLVKLYKDCTPEQLHQQLQWSNTLQGMVKRARIRRAIQRRLPSWAKEYRNFAPDAVCDYLATCELDDVREFHALAISPGVCHDA